MKLALSAAVVVLAAGPAAAQTFYADVRLPPKPVIDLTIERSRANTQNPDLAKLGAITFRYRQELEPIDGGYRVVQTFVRADGPGAAQLPPAMLSASARMVFEVGDNLAPRRVLELPALIAQVEAAMKAMMGSEPAAAQALNATMAAYRAMTPETAAAAMLREQSLVALGQMAQLELGKPRRVEGVAASPFGGPPIKMVETLALDRVDAGQGRAHLTFTSRLDPESMRQSVAALAKGARADIPAEAFANMTIERTTECRYEVDAKSGLATRTECTLLASASDGKRSDSQTDRYVITQALASR